MKFKAKWILDFFILLAVLVIVLMMIQDAQAQTFNVNLFWDANNEPNVTHYNLYSSPTCDPTSLVVVNSPIPQVPNPNTVDRAVVLPRCYAVTAVNNANLESGFSNLLLVDIPDLGEQPDAPVGFKVTVTVTVTP